MRVYGELQQVIDRDAIVIGDGGDFVSYAGRVIESYEPGCWMDPGPYGCLGSGPGYALAAKLARPDRARLLLLGDGAFGFSGHRVRHDGPPRPPVVGVMGNNGIWALEKHPMEFLYGYSVAAELRPGPALRQGRRGPRRPRRARRAPRGPAPGARARVQLRQAGARERAHRPVGRLPAQVQPGLEGRPGGCKPAPGGVLGRPRTSVLRAPCVLARLGFRNQLGPLELVPYKEGRLELLADRLADVLHQLSVHRPAARTLRAPPPGTSSSGPRGSRGRRP